jgi:hypothetical protein
MHKTKRTIGNKSTSHFTQFHLPVFFCSFRQIFVGILLYLCTAAADEDIRYAADVTRLPVSADIAAMGDIGVVLPRRAAASIWNPATAAFLERYEFSAEGADLYQHLSQHGCFSGSVPLKNNSGVVLCYLPFYPGIIERYDTIPSGEGLNGLTEYRPEGYFKNYQHTINLALARKVCLRLPRTSETEMPLPLDIAFGGNCKAYIQMMDPDGHRHMGLGYNVDLGTTFRIGMDYDLTTKQVTREIYLGATIRDALPSEIIWIYSRSDTWRYSPEDYREPFDFAQYYGIAYVDKSGDLPLDWTVALSLHKEYAVTYHGGLEVAFMKTVFFRAGFSDKTPTLGAGFHRRNYFIDYAFRFDPVAITYIRLTAGIFFFGKKISMVNE